MQRPVQRANQRQPDSTQRSILAAGIPFLPQKLTPPLSSPSQVRRQQIVQQIVDGSKVKLILVRAPAGFGKTTVMQQYHAQLKDTHVACTWLSLDHADNDIGRFVAYLAAALHQIDSRFALMPDAVGDVDGFAVDMINRIHQITTRFVLFIDEFESIQNQTILDMLRQMLHHLPASACVVIASRDIPDIGLGRLRAHGQLLEIGPASLRFSLSETTYLLRDKRQLTLADEDIAKLQRCTEGWVTALQLAALSLKERGDHQSFVAKFSGSNADIADYLAEDVLSRQTAEVRHFLLKSSVLQELSTSLCNAVVGCKDAHAMLATLDRANLFLIPLDSERHWYRYHSVFSAFLKAQLEQKYPGEIAALHRRAADWYATNDRPVPAIEHALTSGAIDLALALLDKHAKHLLWQGRVRLLSRWCDKVIDHLPAVTMLQYPELRLIYAWALCLTRRYPEATLQLAAIQRTESAIIENSVMDADFEAQVVALQALVFAMTDRAEECYQLCSANLSALSSLEPFSYGVLTNSMAYCLIAANKFNQAQQLLDKAKQSHTQLDDSFSMAISDSIEGIMDLLQGRLCSATARLRNAFYRTTSTGSAAIGGRATVGISLGAALYDADALVEAETLLTECLPFIKQTGSPDSVIASHLILARIAFQRGDRSSALSLMTDMERLGHINQLPRVVASSWLERARMATLSGDFVSAREFLNHADIPDVWQRLDQFSMHANDIDTLQIAEVRLQIKQGNAELILLSLQNQLAQAEAVQRIRRALKLKILLVEALHLAGQADAAMQLLREALLFASTEGFVRFFIDEGGIVLKLVREVHDQPDLVIPTHFTARILGLNMSTAPKTISPGIGSQALLDTSFEPSVETSSKTLFETSFQTLTERELQVLRLLAEGHPNRVLAERLFVSETTVKAHLRNINTKLSARNRTDAVAIARRLGLA